MPRRNNPKPLDKRPLPQVKCGGKRAFTNEAMAQRAADDGMLMTAGLELDVYQCEFCHKWHLTSIRLRRSSK